MASEMEHKGRKLSKSVAAFAAVSLLLGTAWVGSSGLTRGTHEYVSAGNRVELDLRYRGFCSDMTVSSQGQPLPLVVKDVRSGLARLSLDLPEGEHDVEIHFESVVPGLKRDYPFKIVVDKQPPAFEVGIEGPKRVQKALVTTLDKVELKLATDLDAKIFLEDKELTGLENGKLTLTQSLKPGWNRFLLSAVDRAGNKTQSRQAIFRDVSQPEVVWQTAPDQVFPKKQARIEVDFKDDGEIVGVSGTVNGTKAIVWHSKGNGRWVGVTPDLHEGFHSIKVKAVDMAGNVVTGERQVVIDSSETLGEAVLGLGARGQDAKLLNERLVDAGFLPKGTVLGTFSKETEQALRALQKNEGFEITGRAEGETLAALGPRIYINLSNFSLVLDRPGKETRRWTVASGTQDHPTPTGRFVVWEKVDHPTWLPPDSEWAKEAKPIPPGPDNPLGTRWIGFDWGGVGIHGTNAPWTVGSAASHGCLRMVTEQVEELYELVDVGTPVVVLGGWENDPVIKKYWPLESNAVGAEEASVDQASEDSVPEYEPEAAQEEPESSGETVDEVASR